jgi:glucose-1-phosphate adenylyltransferase
MLKSVFGIVLAGGEGTRLNQLTRHIAKPVVPFAGITNTLSLALGSLLGRGIPNVDIYVQYAQESVAQFVNRYWQPVLPNEQRLRIVGPRTKSGYRGTADAVYHNLEAIKREKPSHVIVTAADHACWIDYQLFHNFHLSRGADLSIAVIPVSREAAAGRLGVLSVNNRHRVTDFQEKPIIPASMPGHADKALASMGIYIFRTEFLIDILERAERDREGKLDFGKQIIPMARQENAKVYAHYYESYWEDLGSIPTYFWSQIRDLLGPTPRFDPHTNPFTPEFGIKQSMLPPVNICDAAITNGTLISGGCVIEKCMLEHVILSPRVRIQTGVGMKDAIIHSGVTIGHGSHLERVIIGEGVTIPPNTVITPEKIDYQGEYFGGKQGITIVV